MTYSYSYTYGYARPIRVVTPLEYAIDTFVGICFLCCFICAAVFGKRGHHDMHHDDDYHHVTIVEHHDAHIIDPHHPSPYPPNTPAYG